MTKESIKESAIRIFTQHIKLAEEGNKKFRKIVMTQLMDETGCSNASAATNYNHAKKSLPPIKGLGREPIPKGAHRITNGDTVDNLQAEEDCFTVFEVVDNVVCRTQSFLTQADADKSFNNQVKSWPNTSWFLIRGLGPNPDDELKLEEGEQMIRQYQGVVAE